MTKSSTFSRSSSLEQKDSNAVPSYGFSSFTSSDRGPDPFGSMSHFTSHKANNQMSKKDITMKYLGQPQFDKTMKLIQGFLILFLFLSLGSKISAQNFTFEIQYNFTDDRYEVWGTPDANSGGFTVGGGSQLTVVLPASVPDNPLTITSVNGGPWTDNSRIYSPTADPAHDFHGIATNGTPITVVANQPILFYHFELTSTECLPGVRLFENTTDPDASQPGMGGGDFQMYFTNVLDCLVQKVHLLVMQVLTMPIMKMERITVIAQPVQLW